MTARLAFDLSLYLVVGAQDVGPRDLLEVVAAGSCPQPQGLP